MKTRKSDLLNRLDVKKISAGHYRWSLDVKGRTLTAVSTDSMLYDEWASDEITLDSLNHIARYIRTHN